MGEQMRPDWNRERDAGSIDALKAEVYGRGRGTGIRIVPRHHIGDYFGQTLSLANDILLVAKMPPDSECAEMQDAHDALAQLAIGTGDAKGIAEAIVRYINARQRWVSRDAVE